MSHSPACTCLYVYRHHEPVDRSYAQQFPQYLKLIGLLDARGTSVSPVLDHTAQDTGVHGLALVKNTVITALLCAIACLRTKKSNSPQSSGSKPWSASPPLIASSAVAACISPSSKTFRCGAMAVLSCSGGKYHRENASHLCPAFVRSKLTSTACHTIQLEHDSI